MSNVAVEGGACRDSVEPPASSGKSVDWLPRGSTRSRSEHLRSPEEEGREEAFHQKGEVSPLNI